MSAVAKPLPTVTPATEPFFAGARAGELRVQRCTACGELRFPARSRCSHCLATGAAWVPVSGRGEVYSFVVMHQVYHPAFAAEVPYTVAVIQLAEGPRMLTNVVGTPPSEIRVGMPVEVVFEKRSDEVTLPQFRRRDEYSDSER